MSDSEDKEDTGIDFGLSLEKLNLGPKKKLLVLGLNGLLVRRVFRGDNPSIPKNRTPDGTYGGYLVYKRPFSDDLMRFCFERFEVGIWSSAKERNVDSVLDIAMGGLRKRLLFSWDQDKCTDSGFKALEKQEKPLFLKELKKIWRNFNLNRGKYSASDTLLIDDKPYKALLNPPNTAVFPESYNPDYAGDDAFDPKGELFQFLGGLADADNVQSYVKENPFGQPAVSLTHPDWGYYSKVLRSLGRG